MDIPADALAPLVPWIGHAIAWPVLAVIAYAARRDLAEALRGHVWLAALVATLVVWQIRAPTPAGPAVHLLGATILTLMFGWRLAAIGLVAVLAASTAAGAGAWASLGVNAIVSVAVPIAASCGVAAIVRRRLPPNPFAYILGAGFAGGGAAMAAVGLASTALLLAASPASAGVVVDHYAVTYLLLVFPEAFVTGTLIAWLVMFYPGRVRTYAAPYPVHE